MVVLFFVLGVRYGQKVEKVNKTLNYYLSLPPTKPPQTPAPLKFQTYSSKGCGIKFLYPASMRVDMEATYSGVLVEEKNEKVNFNCEAKNKLADLLSNGQTATNEAGITTFKIYNTINGKNIYFSLSDSLYPLINSSLKFTSF